MKSNKKFIASLCFIFILLFIVEYNQEEPVDWTPGFGKAQKKPYGDFLLFEMLPELFKNQKIETVTYNITDQLNEAYYNQPTNINYIFINDQIYFNEFETVALLDFISQGNNVFIAATSFSDTLLNSLALKQTNLNENFNYTYADSLYFFNFCPSSKSIDSGYAVRNEFTHINSYFDSIVDNKKMLAADRSHRCILTEVNYGKGKLILCTMPYTFTNYYLLKPGTQDFIKRTLTRLPAQKVWWDEHYKTGANKGTPLRYILDKKSLKWAYYIGLLGIVLFVIFMGKRRQRIIPIVDPMKNASLEFAETVGQVYYEKGDHLNLAQKKIKYFFEYISTKYNINVLQEMNRNHSDFIKNLSDKSGRPETDIRNLFTFIKYIENTNNITEGELIHLNTLIEIFKTIHISNLK